MCARFAQVNSTLSALTGVPKTNTAVATTYLSVQQQLPAVNTIEAFSSANQVGIAQLAVQYCNTVMTTPTLQAKMFPNVTFSSSLFSTSGGISSVTGPLAAIAVSNGQLTTQPSAATVQTELNNLIGLLCTGTSPCNGNQARVVSVTSAACAAALGNAEMMIN